MFGEVLRMLTEQEREYLKELRKLLAEASARLIQMKLNAYGSGVENLNGGLATAKAGIDQILGSAVV